MDIEKGVKSKEKRAVCVSVCVSNLASQTLRKLKNHSSSAEAARNEILRERFAFAFAHKNNIDVFISVFRWRWRVGGGMANIYLYKYLYSLRQKALRRRRRHPLSNKKEKHISTVALRSPVLL